MNDRSLTIALAAALVAGSGGLAFASQTGAQPGSDWHHQGLRATRALNLLEDRGDGQFSHFAASGSDFTAEVTKDGKAMPVLIKPDRGQIQPIGHAA